MKKWLLIYKDYGIIDTCMAYCYKDADEYFNTQGWMIGNIISEEEYYAEKTLKPISV